MANPSKASAKPKDFHARAANGNRGTVKATAYNPGKDYQAGRDERIACLVLSRGTGSVVKHLRPADLERLGKWCQATAAWMKGPQ